MFLIFSLSLFFSLTFSTKLNHYFQTLNDETQCAMFETINCQPVTAKYSCVQIQIEGIVL